MVKITIDRSLTLFPASLLPNAAAQHLWDRRGFSNWQTAKELCFLQQTGEIVTLPRGFIRQAIGILKGAGVQYRIEDRRRTLDPEDFTFKGELHPFQETAVEATAARGLRDPRSASRLRKNGHGPGPHCQAAATGPGGRRPRPGGRSSLARNRFQAHL